MSTNGLHVVKAFLIFLTFCHYLSIKPMLSSRICMLFEALSVELLHKKGVSLLGK